MISNLVQFTDRATGKPVYVSPSIVTAIIPVPERKESLPFSAKVAHTEVVIKIGENRMIVEVLEASEDVNAKLLAARQSIGVRQWIGNVLGF